MKKKLTRTFSLLFITVALLSSALYAQDIQLQVKEFKLDNGLTVILNEDHTNPEISGLIVTKAGGKNDPKDATGMAHYQEHMLFKGTQDLGTTDWEKEKPHIDKIFKLYDELEITTDEEKRKDIQNKINEESLEAGKYAIPNELSNVIKSIGGTKLNAGTGSDYTVFYNVFPPNQIEKWLEIYSHRFSNPVFRSFQSELEVIYEEKNLYEDMFQTKLMEAFQSHFFKNHPYGQQTLIGTTDDLKNPSLTKMQNFFKTYYVANNMALIICGDFNTEEIIPIIEEKFGKWKSGKIPEPIIYEEKPFNGREFFKGRFSPIKLGMLGFRTMPKGHKDELALTVANRILSNDNQTGLLDKLSIDNKLLAAVAIELPYYDHGASVFLFIPKIIGQKLENAEKLVLEQIKKLKNGDFEEKELEAIKNSMIKNHIMSMESNMQKAIMLVDVFAQDKSYKELEEYPSKLKALTKDDIINIAKQYYGDNYFAFFSKMGFPKKDKIDKPGYKPLVANSNAKSKFVKEFEKIETKTPEYKAVDFQNDIERLKVQEGVNLFVTENPLNDIFTLEIKYGIGNEKLPMLKYASNIMNMSGTKNDSVSEFKMRFSKIACNYNISSNSEYLSIEIEGFEENLKDALALINELITNPVLEQEKIKIIVEGEKTNRKMEKSEPDNIADALFDYLKYKERSTYLNRLTMKEISKLKADELVNEFKKATQYEAEIHFAGKNDAQKVSELIASEIIFNKTPVKTESPLFKKIEEYNENVIYFVNEKKALQSKAFILVNGDTSNVSQDPYYKAFNLYFGGGFSGLVLQEIREYRSLAYSAAAYYKPPSLKGEKSYFMGYVGTQADKTMEAFTVFNSLIKDMPEKPERIEMIKPYLSQSAITNRPSFRNLSKTIVYWENKGCIEDPNAETINVAKKLVFNDIVKFYKDNLKNRHIAYAFVGDKKRIDLKELSKYGKIIEVKKKNIFKD
ncbi:MAG: insulinase family protein [Bacteroidetes bacterium]|nr:insulinase family protein [Bacteroidota bacterium]